MSQELQLRLQALRNLLKMGIEPMTIINLAYNFGRCDATFESHEEWTKSLRQLEDVTNDINITTKENA